MLVLSRKLNQAIMIGDDIRIVVVAVDRETVKLGIEAPRSVSVHRTEVYEEIQRANQAAAVSPPGPATEAKPQPADLRQLGGSRPKKPGR